MNIVWIGGGLGNQMFMCAYAKALQLKGHKVFLDTETFFKQQYESAKLRKIIIRENGLKNFNIDIPEISSKNLFFKYCLSYNRDEILYDFLKKNHILKEHNWLTGQYPTKFLKEMVCVEKNSYIKGYFLNEKFFKKYRQEILKMFTTKREVKISENIEKQRNSNIPLVSIHFRKTDFLYSYNGCFDVSATDYYTKAIDYMLDTIGIFDLLIFSDDVEVVKKEFDVSDKGIKMIYPNPNREYEDYEELMLMSYCDHNIIANSTFSWWGAWLNKNLEKIVIAPKNGWAGIEMVPKEWIKL